MGKKKKREKHSGLSLSRIGACLVPGAIFAAVPSTAQSFSETWPRRKKNLSALSTALGSVGNLAQAIVVAESPQEPTNENAGTSRERVGYNEEEYESEGHYAIVDDNVLHGRESQGGANEADKNNKDKPQVEAIYAKVNKKRKPQVEERHSSCSSGSEDDITSVSGMGSEDEDSSTAVNDDDAKTYSRKRNSKKRSGKDKSKKASPRNAPEEIIIEEPVTKTDINDDMVMASADYTDELMEEQYSTDFETNLRSKRLHSKEDARKMETASKKQPNQRNFYSPTQFEREQFNETDVYNYSDQESPEISSRRENVVPLGASASYLANYSPDVPPIGERETPIGKGMSTESIHSYKEKWQTLGQAARSKELNTVSHVKHSLEEMHQEEPVEHDGKQSKEKHRNKQQEGPTQNNNQPNVPAHKQHGRQISQSAQLIRQQMEVANKLRALSAQGGGYAFENASECKIPREAATVSNSEEHRQQSQRIKPSEAEIPEVPSQEGETTDRHENLSERRSRHSKRDQEKKSSQKRKKKIRNKDDDTVGSVPANQSLDNSHSSTLQQMSTVMAKEACRKLYLQVKTLDREKSALETLSQSLNEENTTLKKLNESLTKNMDASIPDTSIGLLQMHIEELKQENNFLKDSVQRLNVELGRYQAKYRPLAPQEFDEMLNTEENQPAWLINKNYAVPLFLAYDDRIKEKQDIIRTYEEQLQSFKVSLHEIMEENVHLQEKLGNSAAIMHDEEEWRQLEKQANLVLRENEVLMERQEMQNKKLEEVTAFYKKEVSRLSEQYEKATAENSGLESRMEVMNTTLNGYKQELETSAQQWKKHVSVEEHLDTVNECGRKLEELRKKTQAEIDSLTFQLESSRDENKSLTLQLADFKLANTQLEREVHSFTEVQRKNERKALLLKEKLTHIQEREANAQDTLNEVLKVAEKTTLERDALNEMLTSENKKAQSLVKLEEDKLKECKSKASLKITAIKGRVKEQERATEMLRDRYENEIKNLKTLIRRQQKQLEDMVNDKRNLENELNVIYEKVGDMKDVT